MLNVLNALKSIFQTDLGISHKTAIPFATEELSGPIRVNRASLKLVDDWIDEGAFSRSYFKYGMPDFVKMVINKPIGEDITYTDLMLCVAKKYFKKVNYLEIGVSVGKNLFQLMNALDNATLTGFDLEELNPVIGQKMTILDAAEWDTPPRSRKKNKSSLRTFQYGEKQVSYMSADVWDSNSWARLQGNKFDMVFSDALHTPKAILFEFEMLVKYGLLADKFVIIWDDLVGRMQKSFFKLIRKYGEVYNIKDIYLLEVNGWVGENEAPHLVGVISNANF